MTMLDAFGDEVFVLPDTAKCKVTKENPQDMLECPISDFGGDCCPEMCDYYTED